MPINHQEQLVAAQVPRPRVLVADDDEAMCALLAVSLADAGYEVEVVRSGKEALLRLNGATSATASVDLVVSDLKMPDLSGLELLEHVQRLRPGLPFVLLSAFLDEDVAAAALGRGAAAVLSKPFSLHALRETLRKVAVLASP